MLTYIHHKNHICGLYWQTHGFLVAGRNSLDILSCTLEASRLILKIVFLCLHNLPGTGSCFLAGTLRTRIDVTSRSTGRECHLKKAKIKIRNPDVLNTVEHKYDACPKYRKLGSFCIIAYLYVSDGSRR